MLDQKWLILGSSPSMPKFIDHVLEHEDPDVVLTTNAGIYECMFQGFWPDVYGVMELDTPRIFGRYYGPAVDAGTQILTSTGALVNFGADRKREMAGRGEQYDGSIPFEPHIILDVGDRWCDQVKFKRGLYVAGGCTGAHLLQYAATQCPRQILMVGMEGYRATEHTPVQDTFDGRYGRKDGHTITRKYYGPLIQQVISDCRDTFFTIYGRPNYDAVGPNVMKCTTPPEPVRYNAANGKGQLHQGDPRDAAGGEDRHGDGAVDRGRGRHCLMYHDWRRSRRRGSGWGAGEGVRGRDEQPVGAA